MNAAQKQTEKPIKEEKTIAILSIDGQIVTIKGTGTKDLRGKLKNYPPESIVEVWRGKKLPLKSEIKVSF